MTREVTAICWAAAMIGLAAAVAGGIVQTHDAKPMFAIMPMLAWASMQRSGSCCFLRKSFNA